MISTIEHTQGGGSRASSSGHTQQRARSPRDQLPAPPTQRQGGETVEQSPRQVGGPSLSIPTQSGGVVLDAETLQVYVAVVQTLLLLYVTYKEVNA